MKAPILLAALLLSASPASAEDAKPLTVAAKIDKQAPQISEAEIVRRANAFFNGMENISAGFLQVGGDGRRMTGKFYLQKPGKLRFAYDAPSLLEVISDGSRVVVRDRTLGTADSYSLNQTPLKFLLKDRIDLTRDLKFKGASSGPSGAAVSVEDVSALGGTAKITLYFDLEMENLRGWQIVDPQGSKTMVSLSVLDRTVIGDGRVFDANFQMTN